MHKILRHLSLSLM